MNIELLYLVRHYEACAYVGVDYFKINIVQVAKCIIISVEWLHYEKLIPLVASNLQGNVYALASSGSDNNLGRVDIYADLAIIFFGEGFPQLHHSSRIRVRNVIKVVVPHCIQHALRRLYVRSAYVKVKNLDAFTLCLVGKWNQFPDGGSWHKLSFFRDACHVVLLINKLKFYMHDIFSKIVIFFTFVDVLNKLI